LTKIKKIFL